MLVIKGSDLDAVEKKNHCLESFYSRKMQVISIVWMAHLENRFKHARNLTPNVHNINSSMCNVSLDNVEWDVCAAKTTSPHSFISYV